jgi:hypothetical protein|tara:strand:+ start:9527 stop:9985 length:459 start_codon:yes stop_codon:yes gene_type:complete
MKQDLGFIILKTDNTAMHEAIFKSIKSIIDNNPYNQICVFNSYNEKANTYNIPIVHLNQAKFFYGNIVVFDSLSLMMAKNFPNINKIFFFVNDSVWSQQAYSRYKNIKEMFDTQNLEFIASNSRTSEIYELCWKKPICVSGDLSYESIKNIL